MATTRTSPPFGKASRAALFDELVKIAQEAQQPPRKDPNWKKAVKAGGLYALGYTAGHGGAMLTDAALSHVFRNKYPHWTPDFKQKVLFPLLGLATLGATVATHYTEQQRQKMIHDE
jgi:hypothetical protein